MAQHPLLPKLGAEVVSTGQTTCRAKAGSESEIDFVIASKASIETITLTVCWEVPFGTHAALNLRLTMPKPTAWTILTLSVPNKLPTPVEKPAVYGGQAPEEYQREQNWRNAAKEAAVDDAQTETNSGKQCQNNTAGAIGRLCGNFRCSQEAERA